jgi:hypothetical protein
MHPLGRLPHRPSDSNENDSERLKAAARFLTSDSPANVLPEDNVLREVMGVEARYHRSKKPASKKTYKPDNKDGALHTTLAFREFPPTYDYTSQSKPPKPVSSLQYEQHRRTIYGQPLSQTLPSMYYTPYGSVKVPPIPAPGERSWPEDDFLAIDTGVSSQNDDIFGMGGTVIPKAEERANDSVAFSIPNRINDGVPPASPLINNVLASPPVKPVYWEKTPASTLPQHNPPRKGKRTRVCISKLIYIE